MLEEPEGDKEAHPATALRETGWDDRDDYEALEAAVRDLVRLDRYERRAWSRQKRAILQLANIKLERRLRQDAARHRHKPGIPQSGHRSPARRTSDFSTLSRDLGQIILVGNGAHGYRNCRLTIAREPHTSAVIDFIDRFVSKVLKRDDQRIVRFHRAHRAQHIPGRRSQRRAAAQHLDLRACYAGGNSVDVRSASSFRGG